MENSPAGSSTTFTPSDERTIDVQRSVLHFIEKQPNRPEGVYLTDIANGIGTDVLTILYAPLLS